MHVPLLLLPLLVTYAHLLLAASTLLQVATLLFGSPSPSPLALLQLPALPLGPAIALCPLGAALAMRWFARM